MTDRRTAYQPDRDFVRIRDFLVDTYAAFPSPWNWGIERWNYARYFVAPMLGSYGTDGGTPEGSLEAIALWERLVGMWEDSSGEIIGVSCIEHPDLRHSQFGEIFIQRHSGHPDLIEEMVAYGEDHYRHPDKNRCFMWAYENDRDLCAVLEKRGYVRQDEPRSHHLECVFGNLPPRHLPEGFRLVSMADECDIDRRREIFGRGFNHEDPKEWPSAFSYRELQRAPDYRLDHDLVVIAPDGTYAACALVWLDTKNRVGHLEPLATHPDFRRMGLAEQILAEGIRRLRAEGATHMPMTGGFEPFYRAFGFVERETERLWVKEF